MRRPPERSLERYHRKRDFRRTPEPEGRVHAKGTSTFVVQKHHARRLHYDFRLEWGGVLKSWAVPKGPSLDPTEKRLAVHVEDHPIEYGGFEGVIPEGQYGGGKVLLWDRGTWIPEGDPEEGYRKGHLRFRLEGVKLKGRWNLVHMKARGPDGDDKNWLLIKEQDEEASRRDITADRPESVLGEPGPPRVWESSPDPARPARRRSRRPSRSGPEDPMPELSEPELATLVEQPPGGDG